MNRINPLYILGLLVAILLIVLYQNHALQKRIAQESASLVQLEAKAKEIATLKRYWGDAKLQKKRILSILSAPFISRFVKDKKVYKNKIHVSLKGVDAPNADRVMDKIFNSFVKVSSFKATQNKNSVDMEVEFAL